MTANGLVFPLLKDHCECPEEGAVDPGMLRLYSAEELPATRHRPGECQCISRLAQFRRGAKILTLCSACHLSSDKRVTV
jgi:hypothetical protein